MFAAAIGMLGAAAVLTSVIVVYGGYAEGAKKAAVAIAALIGDAFEGGPEGVPARALRRGAGALRPGGDRRVDPADAVRQPLRRRALDATVARPAKGVAGPADIPQSAVAARRPSAACAAGAYALPAPASQYLSIGAGGLGGAFILQGLAVAHALSRGLRLRPVMLVALYACCLLRAQYILPVVAVLGLVDAFAGLRARAAFLPTPKPTLHK